MGWFGLVGDWVVRLVGGQASVSRVTIMASSTSLRFMGCILFTHENINLENGMVYKCIARLHANHCHIVAEVIKTIKSSLYSAFALNPSAS